MSNEERVSELLLLWEERAEQGQPVTPEELCRDYPDLLAELEQRIRALQALRPLVEATVVQTAPGPMSAGPGSGESVRPGQAPARYLPLRFHAAGGLGEVFVARDEELHREVALKRMKARAAQDAKNCRRFLVEAEVTGRLEHPGVVPVYGLGHDGDGRPFYAMRFIQGETLQEEIRRFHEADRPGRDPGERALAFRQLLGRFVAICNAVAYAHSRKIVHRDLKPANAMLGKYGETLVVDWGLARPFTRGKGEGGGAEDTLAPSAGGAGETEVGQALGTPAYMSPEQAEGRWDVVGPASDIYSLGATLYVLLTGQAPVEGRSVGEVLDRVKKGEFAPPRQRKADVPRALEAVCLRAMALRPEDRYGSALELAAEVEHWLADEPVTAYREPLRTRLGRWGRRHKTLVAAVAAGLLVALLAGGAGAWWLERQALERRQGVEAALVEVRRLQGQARWGEAQAVLDQARHRLGDGGPRDLKARLDRARGELNLVARLDAIRLNRITVVNGHPDWARADQEYEEAFREAGMVKVGGDTAAAADWVAAATVRDTLVAALDDWAACATQLELERRVWLLEVARLADPDPWRDDVRRPAVWDDPEALARLTEGEAAAKQSPQLLAALGIRLMRPRERAEGLLRAAQQRHPGDFWINFELGFALESSKPAEAVGYFRAALALRPKTPAVHNFLGRALYLQGELESAAAEFHRAIGFDAGYADPHNGLGVVLEKQGKLDQAAAEYRTATGLDSKNVSAHTNLGNVLHAQGKLEEAIAEYRKAIALDPKYSAAHTGLGNALRGQKKPDEGIAEYRKAIALDPKDARARYNLGHALHEQGKREEAITEYRNAVALDPKHAEAHNNLGAVLERQGKLDQAAVEYRTATGLDPKNVTAHTNLGNVLRVQGKLGEAVAAYRKAIELQEGLARDHPNIPYHRDDLAATYGALARVYDDQGQLDQARETYQKALALREKLTRDHPDVRGYRAALADNYIGLAKVHYDQGRLDKAEEADQEAVALCEKLARDHPEVADYQATLAESYRGLALVYARAGKANLAEDAYRKAAAIQEKLAQEHPAVPTYRSKLADQYINLGWHLYKRLNRLDQAEAALQKALAIYEKLVADQPNVPECL